MVPEAVEETHPDGADAIVATTVLDNVSDSQPKGDSLEQRIRTDPDFAVDQYKRVKGESTKLYQQTKKYEAITRIADQLGGAEVASQLLNEYAAVSQSADVARIREHYRSHGTLPTTSSTRTDDTTDEDVYKDPQTLEIESLKRDLADVRNSISQTKGVLGKQSVMSMLDKLREEYPDGFEEHVLPKLETNFADWERTPQGRELLASINYDQLKTVAARAVFDNLDAIAEKRYTRVLEAKKRAATGAGSQTMSTGREPVAGKGHKNALDALSEFRRRYGENYS
jgi:hypothetical protein